MRAYRQLGSDICNSNPSTANALMSSMVSAIVRNTIANNNVMEVIQNRDKLRKEIIDVMKPILTGWGIWIESVELTDVKIMSGALFKNMQCKFRDDQYRIATLQKLTVDHAISVKMSEIHVIESKRKQTKKESVDVMNGEKHIKKTEREVKNNTQNCKTAF